MLEPNPQHKTSCSRLCWLTIMLTLGPISFAYRCPSGSQFHAAGSPIEHVYFPEDGIISIVAVTLDGTSCEVGLIGREGMSETAAVLGTDHSPHEAYVQVSGESGLRLPVLVLKDAVDDSPTLRHHLLSYVQAMMVQLSSSIAAAGQTIDQRLARWLLMCDDRISGNEVWTCNGFVPVTYLIKPPWLRTRAG